VSIGILRIEISDDARVPAVAQPIVVIDAHTVERFGPFRHDRRSWRGVCRRLDSSSLTKWQPAGERNCDSRENEMEMPSSQEPTHKTSRPSPSGASNRRRMRHLTGALWAKLKPRTDAFRILGAPRISLA